VNYARRQQYRRLSRAGKAALASAFAGLLGLVIASGGAPALDGLLLLTALGFGATLGLQHPLATLRPATR
jgi:hypothetical protein